MNLIIPDYSSANVLVIGDVMLDRYYHGTTKRISPEAPVPVVKVNQNEDRPGGAANVALNIASLGGTAQLISLTGDDEASDSLQKQLSALNVDCYFSRLTTHPTIVKLRVLSHNQQLLRVDLEEPFSKQDAILLREKMVVAIKHAKVLILSDYSKGTLSDVQHLIQIAKSTRIPVLIDPKGTDFTGYRGATLLTPNMTEFEAVVGKVEDEADLVAKGLDLIHQLDLKALLVTRSEHGMTLVQPGHDALHLPAHAREVYDVTGAGDTVIATLAASMSAGAPLEQACALANAAAGIVVGKVGTSTISDVELVNAITLRSNESRFGVLSQQQLKIAVAAARRRGERIVMTNGCFDILHAGHVDYLEKARAMGCRLIVAVNDDASVTRLKGENRPVNSLERRMAVLAGLSAVDWIVPFSDDTPLTLIRDILPDCLVKGGDYEVEQIAGYQEIQMAGGVVKLVNIEHQCSTSDLISAIQKFA